MTEFVVTGLAPPGFWYFPYLLEAAAVSEGVALGWRGFVNPYLKSGRLVKVGANNWQRSPTHLYAILSTNGQMKPLAHQVLQAMPGTSETNLMRE